MQNENEWIFPFNDLPSTGFSFFESNKNENRFCDISFRVGDKCIPANSIVVSAAMPAVRSILRSGRSEITEPGVTDSGVFECLLDFAYTCKLRIDTMNLWNLLCAAHRLGMEEVREACCDFLAENLHPRNVWRFKSLAADLDYILPKKIIEHYIAEHFLQICETEEFLDLPFDYLKELIGRDELHTDSEEKVFEAVLKWVKKFPHDRKGYLPDLLIQVRMTYMSPVYLNKTMLNREIIGMFKSFKEWLVEARHAVFSETHWNTNCRFLKLPRYVKKLESESKTSNTERICKVHRTALYDVQVLYLYRSISTSRKESEVPFVSYIPAAALNCCIYLFLCGRTLQYNLETNAYEYHAAPGLLRIYTAVATFGNSIYVCGGTVGFGENLISSDAVECFNPQEDTWTTVSSLRTGRWFLKAIALGKYLYVLGGKDKDNVYNSVERYPSLTGRWLAVTPMLCRRYGFGATVINCRIYVCGGCSDEGHIINSAEMYDPVQDQWIAVKSMVTPRYHCNLVAFSGKLYSIGGKDKDYKHLCSSEIYDEDSCQWLPGPTIDYDSAEGCFVTVKEDLQNVPMITKVNQSALSFALTNI